MELNVFVAEDNITLRENLIGTLEELTCANVVGFASSEAEALAWLQANPLDWDMLIIDLVLGPGSGMRLAERTPRARPAQKILVFSNYVDAAVRKRCARIGVDAVFDKSSELDSLVDYCARQCFGQSSFGHSAFY